MISSESINSLNTSIVLQASSGDSPFGEPGLLLGAGMDGLGQFIDNLEVQPSPEGPPILVSMQNQLTLFIAPSIMVFRDASGEKPCREDFPRRVAQVAKHVSNMSRLTYDKLGMRFEIEFDPTDEELPSRATLRRLVRKESLDEIGYDVVGASVRLWYIARGCLHILHIDPRENEHDSKEYSALSAVQFEFRTTAPSAEWLLHTLDEEYIDSLKVLSHVLGLSER